MSKVTKLQPTVDKDDLPDTGWISQEIVELCEKNRNAIAVYIRLRSLTTHPAVKDGWVYRTFKQWKEHDGLGQVAAQNAIKKLKSLGLIRTEIRTDKKSNTTRTYFFLERKSAIKAKKQQEGVLIINKPPYCSSISPHIDEQSIYIVQQEKTVQQNTVQQQSFPTATQETGEIQQEDQVMKNKQSENVFEALGKVPAPSEKMKNSPERLYGLFVKECGMLTDAEYPELTKKTRAMVVALKKEFGDQTAEFLTQVVRGWGDASAYVGNRKGVFPPKYPGIEFIRSGSNLMWFKQWWVERNTPVSELKIKSAVVIPFPTPVPEVADEDKPMTPEQALAALKQWKESQKAKE